MMGKCYRFTLKSYLQMNMFYWFIRKLTEPNILYLYHIRKYLKSFDYFRWVRPKQLWQDLINTCMEFQDTLARFKKVKKYIGQRTRENASKNFLIYENPTVDITYGAEKPD